MTWVLNQLEALSTRSSRGPMEFLLGTYRLFCTCFLPGLWTASVTPALMELPLAITLGCHCLGCQSICPTTGQDASCKLEKFCKALTQTHTSIWALSGIHTSIQAYKYGRACTQKWSAVFVDTNGDNVAPLKVRSGEIRVAALHWQSDL